jgi:hypothetical protein
VVVFSRNKVVIFLFTSSLNIEIKYLSENLLCFYAHMFPCMKKEEYLRKILI